jgi:hypothetical protein
VGQARPDDTELKELLVGLTLARYNRVAVLEENHRECDERVALTRVPNVNQDVAEQLHEVCLGLLPDISGVVSRVVGQPELVVELP